MPLYRRNEVAVMALRANETEDEDTDEELLLEASVPRQAQFPLLKNTCLQPPFFSLPDELRIYLSSFLPLPDILSLTTVNRDLHYKLGGSSCLWRMIHERDEVEDLLNSSRRHNAQDLRRCSTASLKKTCLTHAFLTNLPSVRWRQLKKLSKANIPKAREGHSSCIMGPPSNRKLVVSGGFIASSDIHILPLSPPNGQDGKWKSIPTTNEAPTFVYGASLTAIDDYHAVRYGGSFRSARYGGTTSGGNSSETPNVCLLSLSKEGEGGKVQASWRTIAVNGMPPPGRAYHTATLLQGRYLVIIGGSQSGQPVLEEAVLDVKTWTWLPTAVTSPRSAPKPSGRYGHSIIVDDERNRLVLFGGATRTTSSLETIKSEVWELKMGKDWKTDFESSLPWEWSKVHDDGDKACQDRLSLGNSHISGKVSTNTALLAFGSGSPSRNGMVAYDLRNDTFQRPQVTGHLPPPRLSSAGQIVDGWLIAYGGYHPTHHKGTLGDVAVLDLAPLLKRMFSPLPTKTLRSKQATPVVKTVDVNSDAKGQPRSFPTRRRLWSMRKRVTRLSRNAPLLHQQ